MEDVYNMNEIGNKWELLEVLLINQQPEKKNFLWITAELLEPQWQLFVAILFKSNFPDSL